MGQEQKQPEFIVFHQHKIPLTPIVEEAIDKKIVKLGKNVLTLDWKQWNQH